MRWKERRRHPEPGGAFEPSTLEDGDELGVLGCKSPLHLFEQSQLFLGERHGVLPTDSWPMVLVRV